MMVMYMIVGRAGRLLMVASDCWNSFASVQQIHFSITDCLCMGLFFKFSLKLVHLTESFVN